jgi:DNA mismatch repair protein MutL
MTTAPFCWVSSHGVVVPSAAGGSSSSGSNVDVDNDVDVDVDNDDEHRAKVDDASGFVETMGSSSASSSSAVLEEGEERRKIRVLPARVVNLISAGEVVQRPASAVKELLENSVDAGATHITVRVEYTSFKGSKGGSKGGNNNTSRLSLLSVSDDGIGISLQDLALAAQRHATSKLTEATDLTSIQTLGFRGEALSSMSCVAQLTVTSRTPHSEVAYQQRYVDGIPLLHEPTRCARQVGTTVTLEELFHNLPSRQAIKLQPSEYARIVQHVIQPYAVHCAAHGIGFHCEKVTHKASNEGGNSNGCSTSTSSVDINTGCLPSIQAIRNLRKQNDRSISNSSINSVDDGGGATELQQQAAAKDAISHLYGYTNLAHVACQLSSDDSSDDGGDGGDDGKAGDGQAGSPGFIYSCAGCVTTAASSTSTNKQLSTKGRQPNPASALQQQQKNPNHQKSRGQLVLFVNHRLVECGPIKRAVESAYQQCGMGGGAGVGSASSWFAYLHVIVPSNNVDVNVHPSKQHVTMLHVDRICQHLQHCLHECLSKQGRAFTVVQPTNGALLLSSRGATAAAPRKNPYAHPDKKKKRKADFTAPTPTAGDEDSDSDSDSESDTQVPSGDESVSRTDAPSSSSREKRETMAAPPSKKSMTTTSSAATASIAPSKFVRTARSSQVGALEPFLVSTAQSQLPATQHRHDRRSVASTRNSISSTSSTQSSSSNSSASATATRESTPRSTPQSSTSPSNESPTDEVVHDAGCPLAKDSSGASEAGADVVDMSQPGAFAVLASLCKCRRDKAIPLSQDLAGGGMAVKLVRQAWVRPKRVIPTDCRYTSVTQLRKRIDKSASREWTTKLRKAVFVGVASRHRSLIQCGEELVEIHHGSLATAMFSQLALWRFAGADVARLEPALDIEVLVGSAAQCEEDLSGHAEGETDRTAASSNDSLPKISETNQRMARQVATCLLQHAELLAEYFSILIEDRGGKAYLVGLPVLLEGYTPAPHGVSHFLLRLATEVDWAEERPCFHGVCRELGNYYGMLDTDPAIYHQVRHMLFPAVSSLLVPTADMVHDESTAPIRVLTSLSKLYRVFERC